MPFRKLLARCLAMATAVLLLTSGRAVVMLFSPGANLVEGARALIQQLLYVYAWALEAALLAPFFARYPLVGRQWRRVPYYLGIGSVAALGPVMVNRAFTYLGPRAARPTETYTETMSRSLWLEWTASFLLFWVVAAIFQTVEARQRVRDLQGRLAQAELENLKSQLHPHFLFNTLHTISVLMRQDVEAANRVLLKLSDLLRVSLDYSRADRIPLQQELDFLEAYLSIERTRFQERLQTSISADGEARAALIPTLLLQPLVENAVRHGIAPHAAGGALRIFARRVSDRLELRVEDDGSGLAADYPARRSRGCGIRNMEGRLLALYGGSAHFEVADGPGGGVAVSISIPYLRS
jgi:two-component system, LytTR family, sensor kinase